MDLSTAQPQTGSGQVTGLKVNSLRVVGQKSESTEAGLELTLSDTELVTWKKCQNNRGQVIYLQTASCHKLEF